MKVSFEKKQIGIKIRNPLSVFLICWALFCCIPNLYSQENPAVGEANVIIKLSNGEIVKVGLDRTLDMPLYFTQGNFLPGERYQIQVENCNYNYVYVIGSDQSNSTQLIYSQKSPLLIGQKLIIPGERSFLSVDDSKGKDYLSILFSDHRLDIKEIIDNIIFSPGNYYDKLRRSLSSDLIPSADIRNVINKMSFKARDKDKIVAITFEIKHAEN